MDGEGMESQVGSSWSLKHLGRALLLDWAKHAEKDLLVLKAQETMNDSFYF